MSIDHMARGLKLFMHNTLGVDPPDTYFENLKRKPELLEKKFREAYCLYAQMHEPTTSI